MDDLLKDFIIESNEFITSIDQSMVSLEKNPGDKEVLNQIFRVIHSIKGACGVFGLSRMEKVAHAGEDVLSRMRDGTLPVAPATVGSVLRAIDIIKEILAGIEVQGKEPEGDDSAAIASLRELVEIASASASTTTSTTVQPNGPTAPPVVHDPHPETASLKPKPGASLAETSLRVGVEILDALMNLVGELVLTRNQLIQVVHGDEGSRYQAPIQSLNRITSDLQEAVMKTRMQPIGSAWAKLPRIVRDVSIATGKQVELVMSGSETGIDRQILQELQDPLTHCIRNAIDHGIELPEVRASAGKPAAGTVQLSAWQEGGQIIVEVRDDGAGVNFDRVRKKVIERGLIAAVDAEKLSDPELIRFLFEPGFSTAAKVTEVSGRGVGMDVVRSNVEKLGGTVDLSSERGAGSVLRIRIPLTLAIVPALVVGVGGQAFAIPQVAVTELVRIAEQNREQLERIHGCRVLRLREQLLPLIELKDTLGIADSERDPSGDLFTVVTQVNDRQVGLVVDGVFDTQEIVVKPAGRLVRDLSVYSGTTILGDGRVIMILDTAGVAQRARALGDADLPMEKDSSNSGREEHAGMRRSDRAPLLLFRSGAGAPKAVPLALVARLEEIPYEKIEQADGRFMVQYRDALLPLIRTEGAAIGNPDSPCPVIVFSDGRQSMGLWVGEILDIVEGTHPIDSHGGRPGVLGLTVVDGHVTEIVDTQYYLKLANPDWFAPHQRGERKPRVLLADGSPFFREILRPDLESRGYEVCVEGDGKAALERMTDDGWFDALVAELSLTGIDGAELASRVRRESKTQSIPMIALTHQSGAEDRDRALKAGFDRFLPKYNRDELFEALHAEISKARRRSSGVA